MMASSGKETLDIKTVHQCNRCLGCKTLHPQASIIRLDHTNVEQHSIKFDLHNTVDGERHRGLLLLRTQSL